MKVTASCAGALPNWILSIVSSQRALFLFSTGRLITRLSADLGFEMFFNANYRSMLECMRSLICRLTNTEEDVSKGLHSERSIFAPQGSRRCDRDRLGSGRRNLCTTLSTAAYGLPPGEGEAFLQPTFLMQVLTLKAWNIPSG